MNEPITRDESRRVSASLQMPQQVPPVDRTSTRPTGADNDPSGVEANFLPLLGALGSLLL